MFCEFRLNFFKSLQLKEETRMLPGSPEQSGPASGRKGFLPPRLAFEVSPSLQPHLLPRWPLPRPDWLGALKAPPPGSFAVLRGHPAAGHPKVPCPVPPLPFPSEARAPRIPPHKPLVLTSLRRLCNRIHGLHRVGGRGTVIRSQGVGRGRRGTRGRRVLLSTRRTDGEGRCRDVSVSII